MKFFILLWALSAQAAPDYAIRNVTLYDGTGGAPSQGDIAITGDRITTVGKVEGKATRELDGTGLVLAPGFIDLHTHSDTAEKGNAVVLLEKATRSNLNYLLQGVTTVVTGNCGDGEVDARGFLKKLETGKVGTNVAHLIPHNAIRELVMGNVNRAPSDAELSRMKALVDTGMQGGAWGLSTGLYYNPGTYAKIDEVAALAKVAALRGGIYTSHIRNEGPELLESIEEAITIGRLAKIPVHISHIKADIPSAWPKIPKAIALIEAARGEGQKVTADQYPYVAASTSLSAEVVPNRFREGTQSEMTARLSSPEARHSIAALIKVYGEGKSLFLAVYPPKPEWQGKHLAEIAEDSKRNTVDVVLDIEAHGGAKVVNFCMSEANVKELMRLPFVATASDGRASVPSNTVPHPRNYGTFPRKLVKYAMSEKTLSVEQAIRSMTGLPADILQLPERGYLMPGYFADLVVYDPKRLKDTATFEKPHQYAAGVKYLFVNGRLAIDKGRYTGALAGKALRHVKSEIKAE